MTKDVSNNIISLLEAHAAAFGDRPALMWVDPRDAGGAAPGDKAPVHQSMGFAQLARDVESAAAGLSDAGIRAGDRVFIFLPMSPLLYVAMFAVQRLGAMAVFLGSWARREQLGACAAQVEPRGFIGAPPALQAAGKVKELAAIPVRAAAYGRMPGALSLEALAAAGGTCPIHPVESGDTALITFTTGSSGPPKGADRTHGFLYAQHRALDACIPYVDGDVDLPVFPIFSLNNVAAGVPTVLPAIDLAKPRRSDGAVLAAQIRATGATCCTLSPSLLKAVAQSALDADGGGPLTALRRVATGGATISPDMAGLIMAAAPGAELHILYGSTEVEPIAHLALKTPQEMPRADERGGVCVGELSRGLQFKLLRLSKEPVQLGPAGWEELLAPEGGPGELVVAGEHVCGGYYKNPEAFERAKIKDGETVWHRTGDVCRLDGEGRLWIVGRVHNAILRGGETLFPVRAEVVMQGLPFVAHAAYLGLPDEELGERAVAAFTLTEGAGVQDPELEVSRALTAEKIMIDQVVRVDVMPLDPRHHSKVLYGELRAVLLGRREGL